jgi:DNA repair protein RecO (recombination protein O)
LGTPLSVQHGARGLAALTSRERLYRTEGIVLRRHDFGEADRLLTIFTPWLGKIRVLAKGVRKPTSRKAGHVELFTHSRLMIAKGRSLDIVTQAETINSFLPVKGELARTSCAYYVAELVDRFTAEGEENRRLFDLLLNALSWLGEADDTDLVLRYFELHLLDRVGYRPQLSGCVRCDRPLEADAGLFSPADGGVLCMRCGQGQRGCRDASAQVLSTLLYLQSRDYNGCSRLRVEQGTHLELESIMRRYITYLLERGLKSADFMDTLRREEAESGTPAIQPR